MLLSTVHASQTGSGESWSSKRQPLQEPERFCAARAFKGSAFELDRKHRTVVNYWMFVELHLVLEHDVRVSYGLTAVCDFLGAHTLALGHGSQSKLTQAITAFALPCRQLKAQRKICKTLTAATWIQEIERRRSRYFEKDLKTLAYFNHIYISLAQKNGIQT